MLHWSDAFIIFFVTLGPLKIIAPFARLTRGADPAICRSVAWRATAIATTIVICVALLGTAMLKNWHVSVPGIVISGCIILFCQALWQIMHPPTSTQAPPGQDTEQSELSLTHATFPLAIPTIVTAPGIAAIAAFVALAKDDWAEKGIILGLLLVVMILNLITLLNTDAISRWVHARLLQVIGWVMAVLQAALAMEYIIKNLEKLGAL